ncbi:MAG: gluconate 2-dehydrogenase subunit 3 family protein [Chloroflexi bacterium]|nr:gluconate 2-dehydrogenase subunit 3 family protein [Chloroflexota bacterium]
MTETPAPLRDSAFVQALFDVVIPPSDDGKLPGAGSLGLASTLAAQLEADPVFGPPVQAGLQAVYNAALARDPAGFAALPPQARVEVVESQLGAHPMLMIGLTLHLYPAYYQHPRVLEGLGEPPRPPFPEGYDLEPTDPHLLEHLRTQPRT